MNTSLRQIAHNEFSLGAKTKDIARESSSSSELFNEAATHFQNAVQALCKIIDKSLSIEDSIQIKILKNYYLYEMHSCLSSYFYEQHNAKNAEENRILAMEFLNKAIEIINIDSKKCSDEFRKIIFDYKNRWTFYLEFNKIQRLAIEARSKLDENKYMEAIDFYIDITDLCKTCEKLIDEYKLDRKYKRTVRGNLYGNLMNISNCYMQLNFNHSCDQSGTRISVSGAIRLMRYALEAMEYAKEAIIENPERKDYYINEEKLGKSITDFLKDNPQFWEIMYIEFADNPQYVKFMKRIDAKKFREIEAKNKLTESKTGKVWLSLFPLLFSFLIIGGFFLLVLLQKFTWWEDLFILFASSICFQLLNLVLLRMIGDLNENNFVILFKVQNSSFINGIKSLFKSVAS